MSQFFNKQLYFPLSGSFSGSLAGTASYALSASYVSLGGGTPYYIPIWNTNGNTLGSSLFFQSGSFTALNYSGAPEDPANPDVLYIHGTGIDTPNILSAHSDRNSFIQINVENYNSSTNASSDVVATADNGDNSAFYIDMGINSSGYTNIGNVGGSNDAYVYSTGNDLYIGNASAGREVIIFNGGPDAINKAKVFIHDQGTVGINTATYNAYNPPSLQVQSIGTISTNVVQVYNDINHFSQIANTNRSGAPSASTDIIAYNDIDPDNQLAGFIDMGILSTNYSEPVTYPGWQAGSSYVYADTHNIIIGSVAETSSLNIFVGGYNPLENSKIILRATNNHSISGSLDISGSISTRQGTINNLTASYAITASYVSGSSTTSVTSSYALTASNTPNALITASVVNTTITFTKGDGSSFPITISQSGSVTSASYANFASNAASASYSNTSSYALNGVIGGANNYITLWSGSSALTSSIMFQNANAIGITGSLSVTDRIDASISTSLGIAPLIGRTYTAYNTFNNAFDFYSYGDRVNANLWTLRGSSPATSSVGVSYILELPRANGVIMSTNAGNNFDFSNSIPKFIDNSQYTYLASSSISDNGIIITLNNATVITGSLSVTGNINGSLVGTASYAATASYWSGSIVTSSYAISSSNAINTLSASYASTASYAVNLTVSGTLTAQTIVVQTITSSIEYSSGSNILGNNLSNTQRLTGSVTITGSLSVNGNTVVTSNQTSSLSVLSSSYALSASLSQNANTASYVTTAQTASYVVNAISASSAPSYLLTSSFNNLTSSFVQNSSTASFVLNSQTGSFLTTSSFNTFTGSYNTGSFTGSFIGIHSGSHFGTSSWANNAITSSYAITASYVSGSSTTSVTSSYALTASYVLNSISSSYAATASYWTGSIITSSYSVSSSNAVSASYVSTAQTASYILNAISSSYALTASYVSGSSSTSITSSYALTASYVTIAQTASYILNAITASYITTAQTASYVLNSISASYAVTASYVSGSSSTSITSSYALTASNTPNAIITASANNTTITFTKGDGSTFPVTVSQSGSVTSASYANFATNAGSSSYAITSSYAISSSYSLVAQTLLGSVTSASYASTASYINALNQNLSLTGSFSVSGSTTQIGNNTLIGNTILSGSVAISGSQLFNGISTFVGNSYLTGSWNVTGSTTQIGNNTLLGNTLLSGSIDIVGNSTLTGSFLVSGSTTQIGNNTLLGNTVLTGSIIISGSIPLAQYQSSSVKIYGNTDMTGYLRFYSQSVNIDTSVSASYIYMSGSTNDLYFAQNNKGYANTTRLRWLEGNLYSGLLNGGVITSQSSTVYQVQSGSGMIVTLNATINDNPYPTAQYIAWPTLSASIAPLSASYDQSFIAIQANSTIFAQGTPFIDGQYDTMIPIGVVLHSNNSTINGVKTRPSVAYGNRQRTNIFTRAFGPLKLSGFTLAVSGSTSTGSLVIGSGTAYSDGDNYTIDPNNPAYVTDEGTTVSKIWRYYNSSSYTDWVYDTNNGPGYPVIDPVHYSNNGTIANVGTSNYSIQRVYWFTNAAAKAIVVYYGNAVYPDMATAIQNINIESFVEAPNTAANALFIGYIVIKGGINASLQNPSHFTLIQSGLFRGISGAGGGGSVLTTLLSSLGDVTITGPTDGQALVYNTNALKWQNASSISASISGNANTSTTASYALTSSYILNSISASYASSYLLTSSFNTFTSSYNTGSFTGSFIGIHSGSHFGTSSWANNASTASYVLNAISSSYAATASYWTGSIITSSYSISSSLSQTSLNAIQATSSSYAATASYAVNLTVSGTLTAQTLIVQTITSSIDFASGSNVIGNSLTNTQQITGSVTITGSLSVNGNTVVTSNQTSSLSVLSSSYASTASYVVNAISASYASSYLLTSSFNTFTSSYNTGSFTGSFIGIHSGSHFGTSSWAFNSISSSYSISSSNAISASYAPTIATFPYSGSAIITGSLLISGSGLIGTASWASNAITASYITTAQTASYVVTALTASYIITAQTASYVLQAISASFAATASYWSGSVISSSYSISSSLAQTSSYFNGNILIISQSSIINQNITGLALGNQTISTNNTGSYTSAFYKYTVVSSSNARAGEFMAVWNGTTIQYTDYSTLDIGNTQTVVLTGSLSGANILLTTSLPTNGWTIKTIINLL